MSRIERLTFAQEQALLAHRDYWLKVGLNTQPSDRTATEKVITEFYRLRGLSAPYFWWCDGPMVAELVLNILNSDNLWDNLGANLGANLGDNLGAYLGDNLWANLGDNLWANLGDNLRDNLGANLGANLWDNLGANLRDNLWANLGANLWDNLRDNLGANLRANLRDNLGANRLKYFYTYFWGSLDSYWLAFYTFPKEHLGLQYSANDNALLELWADLARSTFWWWPFEKIVVISDRPSLIQKDERTRLHSETGPACAFRDGWELWYWHGVRVPETVITNPQAITTKQVEEESNAEVRRVMIERYGQERFLLNSGAQEIHRDGFGVLYRKDLPDDEPLVMVKVRNSTPEPDGSVRDYFLRVPPDITEAHEAVAWTFGKGALEYAPSVET
jgi:hypothetical protein